METIENNFEAFTNTKEDPKAAVIGAINIVAAVSNHFGPTGQLVSMGLGFVSAILGLFGQGPDPKPIDQIVREEINSALKEYEDQRLSDKAVGLISALRSSKAYLDGAAKSGEPLSDTEMIIASSRVPLTQGTEFMGILATVIDRLFKGNKEEDAKKCLKYCELYAMLAALRDMILTQMISMTSPKLKNDQNGVLNVRRDFRIGVKVLFKPLFTVDFDSKIMPFFDPDASPATFAYATKVLKLGNFDRSKAGVFCIESKFYGMALGADFIWSTEKRYKEEKYDKPYTTSVTPHSKDNCYWKLVPRGGDIFSIFNTRGCDSNDEYCNWMLSWDSENVNIDESDPVLWEIKGDGQWKR